MNEPQVLRTEEGGTSGGKVALGCGLGCLAVVLIGVVIGVIAVKTIQTKVDEIASYASSEPANFEYPSVQADEAEEIINRFDNFREAISKSEAAVPLILTADELNILIAQHPTFEVLLGRMKVDLVDDKIFTNVSFKPDDLPMNIPFISKAFAGKFLNGSALVELSIKDEKARLYLSDLKIADVVLPDEVKSAYEEENFMKNLLNDEEFKAFLEKIKELKVEDGALVIIPAEVTAP